jgi:hypothetical protein
VITNRTARVTTGTGWPEAATRLSLPDAWHAQTEWEVDVAYHQGYTDGYAKSCSEIEAALRQMLGGTGARTWKDAVDIHLREVGRKQARDRTDAETRALVRLQAEAVR